MALSTQLVAGLSSGFDWRSMIDQLIAIDRKAVDLVESRKSDYEAKLKEWQSFNTELLSLRTAAQTLKDTDSFDIFAANLVSDNAAVDAAGLLSLITSSSASKGSYTVVVEAVATAQKLSSGSFSSLSDSLGLSYAGDLLLNGKAITINATDSLVRLRDKINSANAGTSPTGVSASIVAYGKNDYRLILTSETTGAQGISLQNGSASDLVQLFGWKDNTSSLKNSITGGAQSDAFSSSTQSIQDLFGLSTSQAGTLQIRNGDGIYEDVSLDLSTSSLEDIKTAINGAGITGVTASVSAETSGGKTTYKLQINGSQVFIDSQNILETLGIVQKGVSALQGTTSGNRMTSNGNTITASTLLVEIDGYNQFTVGDKVTLGVTSRDHSGNDVSGDLLSITEATTIQDLLDAIKTAYEANGNEVAVYVTSEGKIQVGDLESGASSLVVDLQSVISDPYSSMDWGTFSTLGEVRKRQLIAGTDASLQIDGVPVTSSSNTVTDVLPGLTLNLLKADVNTTVSVIIDHDLDAIMQKIESFVSAYNTVAEYIKQQQTYNEEEGEPGGVLFGDGTLSSVKSDLTNSIIQQIWGVSSELSTLGLLGVNLDSNGQLTINEEKVRNFLDTRFNDVKGLFAATGLSDIGSLEYISHSRGTKAGTYAVNITQAATQSTTTGDRVVTGALGHDQTVTITYGDRTATVSLTSDMTLSAIIHAINAQMTDASMNILASNDGGDRLVLTHGGYGSSFTVEESRNDGLWSGSQAIPVIVDNGLDVTGTINGEAATGSGQILKGNSGEANVDGLSIRYSGSETVDVGSVTLTIGVAELFDRALFNITDPYAGYVGFKQESLQNSIKGFETQIEEMEARLDKKMERMINRFVAMETALSKMQSQSQWLEGQITASYSGWGGL